MEAEHEFETPDRKRPSSRGTGSGSTHERTAAVTEQDGTRQTPGLLRNHSDSDREYDLDGRRRRRKTVNTVTPPDASSRNSMNGKRSVASVYIDNDTKERSRSGTLLQETTREAHPSLLSPGQDRQVRFDGVHTASTDAESSASASASTSASNALNQRGVVSRRGGRLSSPARLAPRTTAACLTSNRPSVSSPASPDKETVMEFKTYRSPPRRRDENDTVPSLCSAESDSDKAVRKRRQQLAVSNKPQHDNRQAHADRQTVEEDDNDIDIGDSERSAYQQPTPTHNNQQTARERPVSISCDKSKADTTSPLKSEIEQAVSPSDPKTAEQDAGTAVASANNFDRALSPAGPERETTSSNKPLKTPTRSPVSNGRFQVLPSLDDAGVRSPVGIFLSPYPPTPSFRNITGVSSFDRTEEDLKAELPGNRGQKKQAADKSPKPTEYDRDRFVATPTDFTVDYGRAPNTAGSFDHSNVLAWLQSPTANGLFSPGGLGSIMNTPRAGISMTESRTPRTPTVSTSFFFSDVAGLPRSSETSPKPGPESKRGAARGGLSSIICISPLASSKNRSGSSHAVSTPTNFRDIFASPLDKSKALSILGESPTKGASSKELSRTGSRDPSLDAVHLAKKDLMEDEDLSFLLQVASTTPKSGGERSVTISSSDGTNVFRSPDAPGAVNEGDENISALELPPIGGKESQTKSSRLSRKSHSRDKDAPDEGYSAPSLSMRSNSSSGREKNGYNLLPKDRKLSKDVDSKRKSASRTASGNPKKTTTTTASPIHPGPPTYSMPPPPHYSVPSDVPPYYSHMPPGMPHGGSMRVVIGGPPPSRKAAPSPSRTYSMGPGEYPPRHHYPPPHHGHYPPHGHMHPSHLYYPPPSHHHPSSHMPVYGSNPSTAGAGSNSRTTTAKSKPTKKTAKATKATKRPAPAASAPTGSKPVGSAKKNKKSTPTKKKNKSPQITDRNEREKAAATIQAVNAASGGKNDRAAALAAAILRGVTMRPSGKWQAQLYFAGKSRYIGVFDTREKAALAYEIAREKLKSEKSSAEGGALCAKATEAAVNAARKAAFDGVNEKQK